MTTETATVPSQTEQSSELLKTTNTDVFMVDHRRLKVEEGFNFRQKSNFGDMEGLALSVTQFGVIEAIIGFRKNGEFIVTEGHRRHEAVEMAHRYHLQGKPGFEDVSKIERIPFKSASNSMLDRLLIMGITGKGKHPLTELETARLYESMIAEYAAQGVKRGEAIKEIIKNLGISQAGFYNIISLNKLPDAVREHIASGAITGSTVVNITREIKNPELQLKMVEETIKSVKEFAEKTGKIAKKATSKDVKGLQPKSIKEKLKAIKETLEEAGVNNVRAKAFLELMEGLDNDATTKKLAELFL